MHKNSPQPVRWEGKTYPSINAAAHANNISYTAMRNYVRAGYTCWADIPKRESPTTCVKCGAPRMVGPSGKTLTMCPTCQRQYWVEAKRKASEEQKS